MTKISNGFGSLAALLLLLSSTPTCRGDPTSKPYVPFRTSPMDQNLHHNISLAQDQKRSNVKKHRDGTDTNQACPLQFTLGVSKRSHVQPHNHHHSHDATSSKGALSLVNAPIVHPVLPNRGPGKQVLYATQYEHVDMLTPASMAQLGLMTKAGSSSSIVKEGLVQLQDYPLLFESSSFTSSPIIHDVNGDGIPDAILVDYDGGIYVVGLHAKPKERRYLSRAQIPRLYIRKTWMSYRLNETLPNTTHVEEKNPYHSYFEYSSSPHNSKILQGVTADVMGQDNAHVKGLEERRKRKVNHKRPPKQEENQDELNQDAQQETDTHRRLQQAEDKHFDEPHDEEHHEEDSAFMEEHKSLQDIVAEHDEMMERHDLHGDDDFAEWERVRAGEEAPYGDDDLMIPDHEWKKEDVMDSEDTDKARRNYDFGDDGGYDHMYDDYYDRHDDFVSDRGYYNEEHYIRIPPHVLCDALLVEMPKPYANNNQEEEDVLVLAVSYYLDEDEYEGHFSYKRFDNVDLGDETETQRGEYVANALMFYKWSTGSGGSWGRQEHLDLSGDFTAPQNASLVSQVPVMTTDDKSQMGAFALSTPVVADFDGDGALDLLFGTSMGLIYQFDAQHLYTRDGWPVQMKHPVESRILVEDVVGDTNLELFVTDIGGNVLCLDPKGNTLWHRNLFENLGMKKTPGQNPLVGSTPMSLGDVNGDGILDLVIVICAGDASKERFYVFALSAATGEDLKSFPISIETKQSVERELIHQAFPQPLLVDLHADQTHWKSYLYRNGTKDWNRGIYRKTSKNLPPHGGSALGLHIVQPIGSNLYIIEGGSGCMQVVDIGDNVTAMVQADDVHGTNNLDLVVSTESGNIVTLESPAVPFHPLNVWSNGASRSHFGNSAVVHGMSGSQGIFVRDVSRQYRDIFGVYVPITFEIFDNRPNMQNEPEKRNYQVQIRDGTSSRRIVMRKIYTEPGVYTERVYIPYGPGYYTFTVLLKTSHGLVYEDRFHVGYNVHFMHGFGVMLWLPLVIAAIPIFVCGRKKLNWDDDDFDQAERERGAGRGLGILGRGLPLSS